MSISYSEALEIIADIYGAPVSNIDSVLSSYGIYNGQEALAFFNETQHLAGADLQTIRLANGKTMGRVANVAGSTQTVVDSNTAIQRAAKLPINNSIDTVGETTKFTAKVGVREAGKFAFNEVVPAIAAAGWGITLGKTIDRTLYNANPDFWDTHGMSALNPDTWNSLTTEYDGVAGTLMNVLLGIDGDNSQAYIDEDAAAYMALWMAQQGVFTTESSYDASVDNVDKSLLQHPNTNYVMHVSNSIIIVTSSKTYTYTSTTGLFYTTVSSNTTRYIYFVSTNPNATISGNDILLGKASYVIDGKTYYHWYLSRTFNSSSPCSLQNTLPNAGGQTQYDRDWTYIALEGTKYIEPIEGIGSQEDATLPDTSTWTDLDNTKQSLQNQYPDLWNNAKHYDYVDDEGNNKSKTYIPINLPITSNKNDTQPTTGDEKQSEPQVNPETSPDTLTELITTLLTNLTPTNPPTTGEGDTPTVLPPTGSASSLWAVYNPTQAQVDSFGAWLWSSDLVDQIKKLFSDPMQAIIGIHKVFATPSTGAAQNIKCGYIDSGVPAAVVTNQYTTINCGTVNLREYFGNVFDYAPYTDVSLYLPFIGIVKLDVGDVMRSSITVKYHVDVITGACLADVIVSRDAAGGVLYQYSGSAIVTYPLSSGSYASALAGVLSIAGGVIGTIATGGAAAPALLGAAVGASRLHTDVQKSGGFSGAAGAMGSKIPYIIISRPQTAMANNFEEFDGYPVNHYTKLSNCSGFVRIKKVHVNGVNATDSELDEIQALLMQGVEI